MAVALARFRERYRLGSGTAQRSGCIPRSPGLASIGTPPDERPQAMPRHTHACLQDLTPPTPRDRDELSALGGRALEPVCELGRQVVARRLRDTDALDVATLLDRVGDGVPEDVCRRNDGRAAVE